MTPSTRFQVGEQVGKYRLVRFLGRGTFGEAWLAEDTVPLGPAQVVLKLFCPDDRDTGGTAMRDQMRQRFHEGAVAMAAVNHRHIVRARDINQDGDRLFLVMDYLPGGDLHDYAARHGGRLPEAEALRLVRGVLEGLAACHAAGIVHRDLKPSNILLDGANPPAAHVSDYDTVATLGDRTSLLTYIGTPSYMAPEVLQGRGARPSADVYAVGVMLYEVLTGDLPGDHDDPAEPMRAVGVSTGTAAWVAKAMAGDRARRFADAATMLAEIDESVPTAAARPTVGPMPADPPKTVPHAPIARLRPRWPMRRGVFGCCAVLLVGIVAVYWATWDGDEALNQAASAGDLARVQRILWWGVNVNATAYSEGISQMTALHVAANKGYAAVVRELLEKGAELNVRNNAGATPLHMADNAAVATLLLDKGAEVNAKDHNGETPLHHAANSGDVDLVRVLLHHGADVNARDDSGRTPLHAANSGYETPPPGQAPRSRKADVIDILRADGGKE
jgi:serine/threonine-protein kinase